jgi:hypothetical protein
LDTISIGGPTPFRVDLDQVPEGLLSWGLSVIDPGESPVIADNGTFSPAGRLAEFRSMHTTTLLPDGRVLVVGGRGDGILASAEVWEPSDG